MWLKYTGTKCMKRYTFLLGMLTPITKIGKTMLKAITNTIEHQIVQKNTNILSRMGLANFKKSSLVVKLTN